MTASAFQTKTIQILKRGAALQKMETEHPLHDVVYRCLQDIPDKRPTTLELQSMLYHLCSKHPKSLEDIAAIASAEVGIAHVALLYIYIAACTHDNHKAGIVFILSRA